MASTKTNSPNKKHTIATRRTTVPTKKAPNSDTIPLKDLLFKFSVVPESDFQHHPKPSTVIAPSTETTPLNQCTFYWSSKMSSTSENTVVYPYFYNFKFTDDSASPKNDGINRKRNNFRDESIEQLPTPDNRRLSEAPTTTTATPVKSPSNKKRRLGEDTRTLSDIPSLPASSLANSEDELDTTTTAKHNKISFESLDLLVTAATNDHDDTDQNSSESTCHSDTEPLPVSSPVIDTSACAIPKCSMEQERGTAPFSFDDKGSFDLHRLAQRFFHFQPVTQQGC